MTRATRTSILRGLFALALFCIAFPSPAYAQCPANPVVTNTDDSLAGSLRQAVLDACATDSITFDLPGPGPYTIFVGSAIVIDKDLTITGPSDKRVVIDGGNATEILNVGVGFVVELSQLTIANGYSSTSSSIMNSGDLTIRNSTFNGNESLADGGVMQNFGTATILNSTFSGNSATGRGGAIFNGGTLDLRHVTIAGNTSGLEGGGIANFGTATIYNSIVAANISSDGFQFHDVGSSTMAFNFTEGDPKLGPLQDNGGPTFTHLPLAGSPVLDGADNTLAALAGLTDQRGFARVLDGPDSDLDQTADIGAVEAHPSIADIPDLTIGEDTVLSIAFGLGDELTGFDSITVTSSDQALIQDADFFMIGSGATRTLEGLLQANAFGTATITVTVSQLVGSSLQTASDTFLLTVAPIAETPTVTDATTFAEVQTTSGLVIERAAADGAEVTHFQITGITAGTLFQNDGTTPIANDDFITYAQGNAGLKFTPAGGATPGSFEVQASTAANVSGLGGAVATASIIINPHVTTTSITAHDPNPSEEGQIIDVSFSVASTTGGPAPTGSVTVSAGLGEECTADVSVGSCALELFIPGVNRTLTATYTSDDPLVWLDSDGTAQHTVTACTYTTDVTSSADNGPGSLRQALLDTCAGGEIYFDMTSIVSPITLTSGELVLAKDVYIGGPGATTLTIQRANGTPFRLMRVAEEVVADISGLSLANGDATASVGGAGGAIYNQGFLSANGMDFTGNTATTGGAIANDPTLSFPALTLLSESTLRGNSATGAGGALANLGGLGPGGILLFMNTISGNTAGADGGAIYNTGFVEVTENTITNNRADGDGNGSGTGGGIWNNPVDAEAGLGNSIVAGNFRGAGAGAVPDDLTAVDFQVFTITSLIGVAPAVVIDDVLGGSIIGTAASPIDARLGPLANNGGPTLTHALLPGSPAIDAGDNDYAGVSFGCGCPPFPDQRGTGFDRLRTGAGGDPTDPRIDMGAIEADPTIEDIGNKTTNENAPLSFSFGVGDALTPFDSIVATSSNQVLVPNTNLDLTGSDASRTLAITPVLHWSGTTTITVTATKTIAGTVLASSDTFVLTVDAINNAPTLNPIADPAPIAEDAGPQAVVLSGISAGLNETQVLTLTASSNNPSLIPNPVVIYPGTGATGLLTYTPAANASGTAVITVTLQDDGGTAIGGVNTVVRTFTVVVTPVADTPAITAASTVVNTQSTSGLVISRNPADGPEVTHFKILTVANGTLFLSDGVTPVPAGTFITAARGGEGLRFTPLTDSVLSGAIAVQASLSAGDAGLGGSPTSASIVVARRSIAITLASSANPAVIGQSITFTATVSPAHPGAIQFRDGTTPLGAPVALSGGVATLTIADLTRGTHTITAEDSGSTLDLPGSASLTQTINSQVTVTLASSANPAVVGQSITFTATVSPAYPGAIQFRDGTTPLGAPVALSSEGVATLTIGDLTHGTHTITAEDGGAPLFLPGSASLTQTINSPVTVTLASSANPGVVGQSITFTATVSPAHAGAIQFRDGTTPLGAPVPLSGGVATLTIGDLTRGTHIITAEDGGAPLYLPGSASLTQSIIRDRTIVTGAGAGDPRVRQFGAINGGTPSGPLTSFLAYDAAFAGGVRVAEADINGDGVPDIVTAPGPGAPPRVNVFDGATGGSLRSFLAYDESFRGGVFVAAGDVDGDGRADIVTGMDAGAAPQVRVFSGASGAILASFNALPSPFSGGVRVAVGDINGDGRGDIVVGMGPGGSSVRAYSGATTTLLRSFDAYPGFLGGVFVAAGDVNGDGVADIVTGAGEGGGPHVKVYDGRSGEAVSGYFAAAPTFNGGVRVAVGDVNGDGYGEVISGMGPNGGGLVVVSDLRRGTTVTTFPAYGEGFAGGVFVATAAPDNQMAIDTPAADSIVSGGFRLAGWAIQEVGASGTGVDLVHVWAYPRGGAPFFLGEAVGGDARPDVAAVFGDRYATAGFHLDIPSLGEGDYEVVAFAHNAVTGNFTMARVVSVHVPAREVLLQVDLPTAGATIGRRFRVVGWSHETHGTPIEAIHVWAYPASGAPFFLGAATLGDARPDVAATFGPAYATSGYHLDVSGMPEGNFTVVVFAKALDAPTFAAVRAIPLTVSATAPPRVFGNIDLPSAGPLTSGTFTIAGWAVAQNAPTSPGIDTMHVWALPVGGGAPRFLGVPDVHDRPDIAGLFGAEFQRSGFSLRVSSLPSGTWDIVVYIWPTGGTGFTDVRVVRVTVP